MTYIRISSKPKHIKGGGGVIRLVSAIAGRLLQNVLQLLRGVVRDQMYIYIVCIVCGEI